MRRGSHSTYRTKRAASRFRRFEALLRKERAEIQALLATCRSPARNWEATGTPTPPTWPENSTTMRTRSAGRRCCGSG